MMESSGWKGLDLHGYHLHVSPSQVSVQLVLVGHNDSGIVRIDAELATPQMVAQTGRFLGVGRALLLRIPQTKAFSASAHLCNFDNKLVVTM